MAEEGWPEQQAGDDFTDGSRLAHGRRGAARDPRRDHDNNKLDEDNSERLLSLMNSVHRQPPGPGCNPTLLKPSMVFGRQQSV